MTTPETVAACEMTMTMTNDQRNAGDLLELLEVNRDRLPAKSGRAVAYCQVRWVENGKPTARVALADFLDKALKFCAEVELPYPLVFLLRLKQLQRAEWSPRRFD